MNNVEKARELISMLAIAKGMHKYGEYKEALKEHENLKEENFWDDVPEYLRDEFFALLQETHQKFRYGK